MFTIESILIPTDFSLHADDALGYAKALATPLNATLHLVHVIEPVVRAIDDGKARIGAADVADQNWELETSSAPAVHHASPFASLQRGFCQPFSRSFTMISAVARLSAMGTS